MSNLASESLTLRVQAEQIADVYTSTTRIGRPAGLSEPDQVQAFLAAITDGNYRETACKLAGISKSMLHRWLESAEHGDEAAIAFRNALEKAEAFAESETVRNVRNASKLPQFWAAGMTWLERKSPDRWGRRQDDQNTPKVVVQIGVRDSDVQVNLGLSPVPRNELSELSTGQVTHEGLITLDSVNHKESEGQALPAPDPAGGPKRGGVAPSAAQVDGQGNRPRGGRKKKA
jgi:hypothetical protein